MKKIYQFLVLLLVATMGVGTAARAQEAGVVYDLTPTVSVKDSMIIVLQQGTYQSASAYFNPSGSYKAEVDGSCIYQVKYVSKLDDGTSIYALYNPSTKTYLSKKSNAQSVDDAWQCSIEVAEFQSSNQRKFIYGIFGQEDVTGRALIFAAKDNAQEYLVYSACPGFAATPWCNDWFVYEAVAREATARDKFESAYREVFGSGCDTDLFPVGDHPGCITQALYDEIQALYDRATAVRSDETCTDSEVEALTAELIAIKAKYESSRKGFEAGKYYTFANLQFGGTLMYESNGGLYVTVGMTTLPDEVTTDHAAYIFTLEDAGNGAFYVKNFLTQNYFAAAPGLQKQWLTTSKPARSFTMPFLQNRLFNIQDPDSHMLTVDYSRKVLQWDDANSTGNQFYAYEVSDDVINMLSATVEKKRVADEYRAYYNSIKTLASDRYYASGITKDGNYANMGLVYGATTNAQETTEGSIYYLFDGNKNTYFHSRWSGSVAKDGDYDWLQFDLGQELTDVALKFTKRYGNTSNAPTRIAIVAPAEGDEENGIWHDTLVIDTVIYQYDTDYPSATVPASTAIFNVKAGHPVQNLRLAVINTTNNAAAADGPFFSLSELRAYTAGDSISPRYLVVPEDVRNNFDAQVAHSDSLLSDAVLAETDIETLKAGLAALRSAAEAFTAAYPDPAHLNALLGKAYQQAAAAGMEGDDWGYFQAGAQAELRATLESIEAEIGDRALSLAEIAFYEGKVNDAVKVLNSHLNMPANGEFVRLVGAATSYSGSPTGANGHYFYVTDADTTANLAWGYADDSDKHMRLNAIWQVVRRADGTTALRNAATGRYLSNVYEGAASRDDVDMAKGMLSVAAEQGLNFISAREPGVFVLQLFDSRYVNAETDGTLSITNSEKSSTYITLEAANVADLGSDFKADIKANGIRIMALPIALSYTTPAAYRVLGVKDNKLQLEKYGEDDIIPAATPFILISGEGETVMNYGIAEADAAAQMAKGYTYDAVEQNGMVSAICATVLTADCGILADGQVKGALDGSIAAAGTGYFTAYPQTDKTGDVQLDIDATTGIAGLVTTAPTATHGAYSITGVKVNAGHLPAGLYIINGKKVVVK